jgi:glutamate racemase
MAHDFAYDKKILVMATNRTIESEKFQKLYNKYDNSDTILLPCSGLADLIEKDLDKDIDLYLRENLTKYIGVECVVLGCTHYPLIKSNIQKVLGNVEFFDGSSGVSKRVYELLEKHNLLNESTGSVEFFDSSFNKTKEDRFFEILNN